jgi:hypothetical protein
MRLIAQLVQLSVIIKLGAGLAEAVPAERLSAQTRHAIMLGIGREVIGGVIPYI